jgi:hypothetical protein
MDNTIECKVCGHVAGLHDTEYCLMSGCECEAGPAGSDSQFPWHLDEYVDKFGSRRKHD